MNNKKFGMGSFHGKMPFRGENLGEKWLAMSDEEKKEFMEKRIEMLDNHFSEKVGSHRGHKALTVEDVNSRVEKWQKMSDEEKEAFVQERNERGGKRAHKHHHAGCHLHQR
jgi:predicted Fe-S protein YdhL (DUF1289 family)